MSQNVLKLDELKVGHTTFIKPDSNSKVAPAGPSISVGNDLRFSRQVGTGFVGSKDKSDTFFSLPQLPPIIMMNWVGEIVVLVVVVVVVVVVEVVLEVDVVAVLEGEVMVVRSCGKVKQFSFFVI